VAIQLAVDWLLQHNNGTPATIFTDSLSAIQALQSASSAVQSATMLSLLSSIDKLQPPATLVWIPSHIGISGNEAVDKLAKCGTQRSTIDIQLPYETKEEFANIDDYTQRRWQADYDANPAGQDYRALEPLVSNRVKFTAPCRRKENVITRLRLGKCRLNKYLHDIKKHPDGLCESCHEPETIKHLLLECKNNGFPAKLTAKCHALQLDPSLQTLLSNKKMQDLVFELILSTKRTI